MTKLTIDGHDVEVPAGTTIFQACEHAGIEVAHFCYHERLAIAGNCRMCLVEVEKSPKPIASCAMPAADGMVVHTKSPKAIKAQSAELTLSRQNLTIIEPSAASLVHRHRGCDLHEIGVAAVPELAMILGREDQHRQFLELFEQEHLILDGKIPAEFARGTVKCIDDPIGWG